MPSKEQLLELDNMQTSIFTVASRFNMSDLHDHKVGQLSVPQNGVIYLLVNERLYIVPPHQAIFIPKNIEHQVYKINKNTLVESIYFTDQYKHQLPQNVTMISLTELAKVLIARLCQMRDDMLKAQKAVQMLHLLLSELHEDSQDIHFVKIPQNTILKKVFDFLTQAVDILPNLDSCAKLINVSPRTLQRMINEELNLSFILWRQKILFVRALELLGIYHKTSVVAYKLGYNSESAFISMFKKMSGGVPPSKMISKNIINAAISSKKPKLKFKSYK